MYDEVMTWIRGPNHTALVVGDTYLLVREAASHFRSYVRGDREAVAMREYEVRFRNGSRVQFVYESLVLDAERGVSNVKIFDAARLSLLYPTITVEYSCVPCGLKDIPLAVRQRGNEDVVTWMNAVRDAIGIDHKHRSPRCQTTKIDVLKIPMPAGTEKVGGPVVQ